MKFMKVAIGVENFGKCRCLINDLVNIVSTTANKYLHLLQKNLDVDFVSDFTSKKLKH